MGITSVRETCCLCLNTHKIHTNFNTCWTEFIWLAPTWRLWLQRNLRRKINLIITEHVYTETHIQTHKQGIYMWDCCEWQTRRNKKKKSNNNNGIINIPHTVPSLFTRSIHMYFVCFVSSSFRSSKDIISHTRDREILYAYKHSINIFFLGIRRRTKHEKTSCLWIHQERSKRLIEWN